MDSSTELPEDRLSTYQELVVYIYLTKFLSTLHHTTRNESDTHMAILFILINPLYIINVN